MLKQSTDKCNSLSRSWDGFVIPFRHMANACNIFVIDPKTAQIALCAFLLSCHSKFKALPQFWCLAVISIHPNTCILLYWDDTRLAYILAVSFEYFWISKIDLTLTNIFSSGRHLERAASNEAYAPCSTSSCTSFYHWFDIQVDRFIHHYRLRCIHIFQCSIGYQGRNGTLHRVTKIWTERGARR